MVDKLREDGLLYTPDACKKVKNKLKRIGRILYNSDFDPSVYRNIDAQLNKLDKMLHKLRYEQTEKSNHAYIDNADRPSHFCLWRLLFHQG